MIINDLSVLFPENCSLLQSIESELESTITRNPNYKGFIKLLDSFFFLFSDDIKNSLAPQVRRDPLILLYSEAYKRIRSSSILALKGYYIDSVCILRSVYELNKGINAIQNSIISSSEYFFKERDSTFADLPDRKKEKLIEEHSKNIDYKINKFDNKDIPEQLKCSLRDFRQFMHYSVHKAKLNLILNFYPYIREGKGNLFRPHNNIEIYIKYMDFVSYMILIYLHNILNSNFLSSTNYSKIIKLAEFIESAYEDNGNYHADIVDYIVFKYKEIKTTTTE